MMFIVNDIELLVRLGKHRILQGMLARCPMAVSAFKLSEYSFQLRKELETYAKVPIMDSDGEFMVWAQGKGLQASVGDLSSMYLTLNNKGTLILSHEEELLQWETRLYEVTYMGFDDFIFQNATDDRMIQLYNLIKAA